MKQGWEIKKLSDIGKVFNGNSINEKVKKDNYTDLVDGYSFVATKDVGFDSKIDYENGVKIPFSEKAQFKIAPANTPLICAEGGSAGKKIAITNQDVCFGNKLFALVPNKNVDSKFIFYYYFHSSFQKYFAAEMAGIIGGVSMNKFKEIEIPLPPLPEQKQIVAILDESFAAIDKAKANAKLNHKNAKELFESYLHGVFENKMATGKIKTLIDFCEFKQGIQRDVKLQSEIEGNNQVRFLRIIDFTQGDELHRYIDNPGAEYVLGENDISLVRYGASTGFVCTGLSGALANNLFRVIPRNKNELINEFLYFYLKAPIFQRVIKESMNGAAMPAISFGLIEDIPFPVVSLSHQKEIVQKLKTLADDVLRLESIYKQKIDDLEELKKSILQKAFCGELEGASQ
ncbi:MAG: restriction endonuclease subunit S [Bdellovibrio sp.]|nr:restriction endonuclease subunit S [Bdellovibrio sp.]